MDRRRFLGLLAAAPLAFNSHRVIFDMGRELWKPQDLVLTPEMVRRAYDLISKARFIDALEPMRWSHDVQTGLWLAG